MPASGMRYAHFLYQKPTKSCLNSSPSRVVSSKMMPVLNVGLGLVSFVQPCDMMNGVRS